MPDKFNFDQIKAVTIDMDGVLWRGDTPLPGLNKFFDFLHRRNIPYMLATNNASKTPSQYRERLGKFGVSIDPNRVMTSSLATAVYLEQTLGGEGNVYVIGGDGIRAAVQQAGFTLIDNADQPAKAVVAGIDFNVTYDKLKYAVLHIQRGARFIGTNGDRTFPAEEGFYPGAGAILAAVQAATNVEPTVIGKPERLMFEIAVGKMNSRPGQTAMVGDRLETDIIGAQRAGLKTILVTTGVDNRDSVAGQAIQPDAIFSGIDTLTDAWMSAFNHH